jgi:hypothetical protein
MQIQISFFSSCAFPIGQSVLKQNLIGSSKSNRKLINFLSNELIKLRKGIGVIFYQHFHCIDSNVIFYSFLGFKLFNTDKTHESLCEKQQI